MNNQFASLSSKELVDIDGGKRKSRAYTAGYYTGKSVQAGAVLLGAYAVLFL
ncbi:hypothetical protein [Pediococcus claussenii]|nr:hypothetical protein [Pediococcus claussenii]